MDKKLLETKRLERMIVERFGEPLVEPLELNGGTVGYEDYIGHGYSKEEDLEELTMLGAVSEDANPADDIDEKAAVEVLEDVQRLRADAPEASST